MFCTNCGTRIDDDMAFCPECGAKVIRDTADEVKEEVKETSEEVKEAAEEVKEEVKEDVKEEVKETSEEVKKAAEEVKEEVKEDVKEEVKETSEEVKKAAEEVKEEVKEDVKEEVKETSEEVKKAAEVVKEEVKAEVPQAAAPQPQAETAKDGKVKMTKNGLHRKPSGGKTFLSFLICILLFVAILLAGVLQVVRMSFSEKQVRKTMDTVNFKEVTLPDPSGAGEVSLVDFMEKASGFDIERSAGIDKKALAEFMAKPYVKQMVTDYLAEYLGYFFENKTPKKITRDDFVEFIREHNADLLELTGFSFCYTDKTSGKEVVYTADIDNAFKDLGTDEIGISWIEKQTNVSFGLIQFGLSFWCVIGLTALAVLLVILLIIINAKTMYSGWGHIGRTVILDGAVMCIAALVAFLAKDKMNSNLISAFAKPAYVNMAIVGGCILVLGFVLYAFNRMICNAIAKSRQKKAK